MKPELWHDIERALDARRSPFEDRALAARIARDPAAERATRRLVEGLARVEHAPARRRSPRRMPLVLAGAAAVLLVALGAWSRSTARAEPRRAPEVQLSVLSEQSAPRLAHITLEPTRVLAWTLESEGQ